MTVRVGIIPAEVHSNFGRAYVFDISVVEGSTPFHSEGVGFYAADSTEREERVGWIETARSAIEDLVWGSVEGVTVGDGIVKMNGVLFEAKVILGWKMVWEEIESGCGEFFETLLKAFIALAVFQWGSVL